MNNIIKTFGCRLNIFETEVIKNFITNLGSTVGSDILTFKNIDTYILSYDHNKNLVKSSDIFKSNLKKYLNEFRIISDDVNKITIKIRNLSI